MTKPTEFYSDLSSLYHLIYVDWDKSIDRQASMLNAIIQTNWGSRIESILDVSCGIGTQSLGLSRLGYKLTASDISPKEINRARAEAKRMGLTIPFSVADMRTAYSHHKRQFDLIISCDNSVPHLLSDNDILTALRQFYDCTRPGGGCLISLRDYSQEDLSQSQLKPYGIRQVGQTRWVLMQHWEPEGKNYNLTFYFIEDDGRTECKTHVFRTSYYPIFIERVIELAHEAGFSSAVRKDDAFFQPIIIMKKDG
jgi:SAM-dependent methyltransferase